MFRDRNEELNFLIDLYHESTQNTTTPAQENNENQDDLALTNSNNLRAEIESFSTIMVHNMIEDKDLDIKFANTVYEFDPQLFRNILKTAIEKFFWTIGFFETLRMIGEVKYFAQAIEGYKTIFEQLKDKLADYHEYSYNLRDKLENMTKMRDFDKLTDDQRSQVEPMVEMLEPFSMLPKPVKSKRVGNWAQHFLILAQLENSWAEEQNKFFSLFRRET